MWNNNSKKNYADIIKFLYNNLKMSDNFINKMLYSFWQKTDIYKKLKEEEKHIISEIQDYYNNDVSRDLLLKWNQKYQIKYNDFLEKIKVEALNGISNTNPDVQKKIQEIFKRNRLIKKQLTEETENLSKIDILIDNNTSNNNVVNDSATNNINKNKDKKVVEIIKYNEETDDDYDSVELISENIYDDVNNIKINNNDSIELKKEIDAEKQKIDKMPNINKEDIDQYNEKYVNTNNKIDVFSNDIDKKLTEFFLEDNRKIRKYNRELENRKKFVYENKIFFDKKVPNFAKEISKLKKEQIPAFDIIINPNEKIYIYKKANEIIIHLHENIKKDGEKLLLINNEKAKEKENNSKISLPIRIIRTKKFI